MTTQHIRGIDLMEDGSLLCEIHYSHEDGEITRDWDTLSALDITERYEIDDIRGILGYKSSEELGAILKTLYIYAVEEAQGNFSSVIFATDDESEAIDYVRDLVERDISNTPDIILSDSDYDDKYELFMSYYSIATQEEV